MTAQPRYPHLLAKAVQKLESLRGWRAGAACFATGALLAAAFAPYYYWLVIAFCLPIFFILLNASKSPRHAMARAFMFGYGYFMAGTWWIANALTVDMAAFGWLIPFSILGLSAALGLYFAPFGWLYLRLRGTRISTNILLFALLWLLMEVARSIGILGFPWNLMGYAALASLGTAQLASIIGVFGLSLVVVLLGLTPLLILRAPTPKTRYLSAAATVLLLCAWHSIGASRIPAETALTDTTIQLVQPNIPQSVKASRDWQRVSYQALTSLSKDTADITIWPETAYPLMVNAATTQPLSVRHGTLLTGALRMERDSSGVRLYNSLIALDAAGQVLTTYDKHQLVPFGEFVPLRKFLPIDKITPGTMDFSRGNGTQTQRLPGIPAFSPLVCYEIIFPWMAVARDDRPEWLVNVTNDGWYGDSAGPYQHLAAAQMRAIEQGLPVVRAANSGISAIIDPYGRINASIKLNNRGSINYRLQKNISEPFYAKHGNQILIYGICCIILAFLLRCAINKNK